MMTSIGAQSHRHLRLSFPDLRPQRHRHHLALPVERSLLRSSSQGRERNFGFSLRTDGGWGLRFGVNRCQSESSSFEADESSEKVSQPDSTQKLHQTKESVVKLLRGANAILPHVVLASTLLALAYPPSFTWFTSSDSVWTAHTPIGAGIMLTSCVSGAQLSNYATFLTDPPLAPLSIVMTSLSTASAVLITPILSLLLIGKRLPVDVRGMVSSITQIVISPIAVGLFLNRFFPQICDSIRPLLPPLSVFVTALCVGAPLAINRESVLSPFGTTLLFIITAFHLSAFVAGYAFTGAVFQKEEDVKALQRTMSFETGMQSSLLALALANRFFQDPLVAIPPAMSVVIMSLMGFSLVMLWAKRK